MLILMISIRFAGVNSLTRFEGQVNDVLLGIDQTVQLSFELQNAHGDSNGNQNHRHRHRHRQRELEVDDHRVFAFGVELVCDEGSAVVIVLDFAPLRVFQVAQVLVDVSVVDLEGLLDDFPVPREPEAPNEQVNAEDPHDPVLRQNQVALDREVLFIVLIREHVLGQNVEGQRKQTHKQAHDSDDQEPVNEKRQKVEVQCDFGPEVVPQRQQRKQRLEPEPHQAANVELLRQRPELLLGFERRVLLREGHLGRRRLGRVFLGVVVFLELLVSDLVVHFFDLVPLFGDVV